MGSLDDRIWSLLLAELIKFLDVLISQSKGTTPMSVTAAQYAALKTDASKVAADEAALTTDTTTQTTDQTAFASGLTGPVGFLSADGTSVDIVTPSADAPGYTVETVTIVM